MVTVNKKKLIAINYLFSFFQFPALIKTLSYFIFLLLLKKISKHKVKNCYFPLPLLNKLAPIKFFLYVNKLTQPKGHPESAPLYKFPIIPVQFRDKE